MAKELLRVFIVLWAFQSTFAFAFDIQQEASQRGWLDRLFYVDGKSLVRNDSFFISKTGKFDPARELEETIELMQREQNAGIGSFACKFPSRYSYITARLGLKEIKCPQFEQWRNSFEADGMSIMFASQYLENPASSFGHTYLKINSRKKALYLNKVISFAATVPENVGAGEYVWKGLTGGFQGMFAENPFYILFQEYANMEKRDIWEYELTLSAEQTNRILGVLYEIVHNAEFDYYFLTENCSSLLLRLIDIEANKKLLKDFPFYIIPIETVKALDRKGLIEKSIYHPSITSRLSLLVKEMDRKEVNEVLDYVYDRKKFDGDSSSKVLDFGLEYLNFKRQKNGGVLAGENKNDFDKYLFLRAKISEPKVIEDYNALNPVKASHPRRFSLGVQSMNDDPVRYLLAYRPVGKDFFDRSNGYAKESEINFLKSKILIDQEKLKSSWVNLDVIGIKKYADYDPVTQNTSWGLNLSFSNAYKQGCESCYYSEVDSYGGIGKNIFNNSALYYIVFHPTIRIGNLKDHANIYPQVEVGLIKSNDYLIFKTAYFEGGYFRNSNSSVSWILNDEFSLNFIFENYWQEMTFNTFESGVSFYF